ncbi:MAG: class I SAM-dependent DNA methyltransferase [Phycisphaerales bacterium]
MTTAPSDPASAIRRASDAFDISFPTTEELAQDAEWCEATVKGERRRFRFHDYDAIYQVPGLYEALFYKRLKCASPRRVVGLLGTVMQDNWLDAGDLRVLDVGAGNGIVGERLRELGSDRVVGVDIIPEARESALRDRPRVYDEYHVADLTDLKPDQKKALEDESFNGLTVVAALGFNDIPPMAFAQAYNLVEDGGWLAFNVKEDFLEGGDDTGFARLIRSMDDQNLIQINAYQRYPHRKNTAGDWLYYVAIVARKRRDLDLASLED